MQTTGNTILLTAVAPALAVNWRSICARWETGASAVQTELTPGQSVREGYLPLNVFMDEVMVLFSEQPTPSEIVVERARLQRLAEREGRFERVFERINANAAQQRQ